ncbi:hypothetical protein K502DRAFT_322426 [Neoconidiobolus thromboides FSU 785]|nr:hypothetical protein K502DRAFT_322426 [Neoconidiobolus thromboides FSU 785]
MKYFILTILYLLNRVFPAFILSDDRNPAGILNSIVDIADGSTNFGVNPKKGVSKSDSFNDVHNPQFTQHNNLQSNPFQSNNFQANNFQANNFQANSPQSNPFQANNFRLSSNDPRFAQASNFQLASNNPQFIQPNQNAMAMSSMQGFQDRNGMVIGDNNVQNSQRGGVHELQNNFELSDGSDTDFNTVNSPRLTGQRLQPNFQFRPDINMPQNRGIPTQGGPNLLGMSDSSQGFGQSTQSFNNPGLPIGSLPLNNLPIDKDKVNIVINNIHEAPKLATAPPDLASSINKNGVDANSSDPLVKALTLLLEHFQKPGNKIQ